MAKIILISLPAPFASEPGMNPPLGLCYIGGYLKHVGHSDIHALDFALYKEYDYFGTNTYLSEIPLDGKYYGIYCMSSQFRWLVEVTNYIKDNVLESVVVCGGPHASTCPEECLRVGGVDIAVRGEGEEVMHQIISEVPLSNIGGACYLTENGVFKDNERAFISDIDSLPFPDRDLFDFDKYKRNIQGERAAHIVTLRGCPYSCAFCDKESVGTNVRYRSVGNVLAEIDMIRANYNINAFVIYDDIFTIIRQRVEDFSREFKRRGLKWRCWSRTNTIDKEKLRIMKDSGLTSITFGVESGDDGVLSNINKKATVKQNRDALLACKELGIPVRCSLMFGNPGECRESVENTVKLIEETQPDEWNLSILAPVPGSDIWNNPEKYGVIFDKDWVRENFYYVTNRFDASGIGSIWISLEGLDREKMAEILEFFTNELERVCPRHKVQDTIQDIDISKVRVFEKGEHENRICWTGETGVAVCSSN